jgi:hypothetical protein
VHDSLYGGKQYQAKAGIPEVEAAYFKGTGKSQAKAALKWAEENLSEETNKKLASVKNNLKARQERGKRFLSSYSSDQDSARDAVDTVDGFIEDGQLVAAAAGSGNITDDVSDAAAAEKAADEIRASAEDLKVLDAMEDLFDSLDGYPMKQGKESAEAEKALYEPLHPSVIAALRANKLEQALKLLARTSPSSFIRGLAEAYIPFTGATKVRIADNQQMDFISGNYKPGTRILGEYYPPDVGKPDHLSENVWAGIKETMRGSIFLNEDVGFDAHTLLHEMTHAATVANLRNPNIKQTRQLRALYNKLVPILGDAYAGKDVYEFVAEIKGNIALRKEMANTFISGQPISSLRQFLNIMGNWIRGLLNKAKVQYVFVAGTPKDSVNVVDRAEAWIDAILAPAVEYNGKLLQGPSVSGYPLTVSVVNGAAAKVMDKFAVAAENEGFRTKFVDKVRDVFSGTWNSSKSLSLQFIDMQDLADVAKFYGVEGVDAAFIEMKNMDGATYLAAERVEATAKYLADWNIKVGPERTKLLNKLATEATMAGLDPTLTEREAIAKYGVGEAVGPKSGKYEPAPSYRKMDEWYKIKAMYEAKELGPDGRKMYRDIEASYITQVKSLETAIFEGIDSQVPDGPARTSLKKQILAHLAENSIKPYFPLPRQGDFWIDWTSSDGEQAYQAFQSRAERDRFVKTLKTEEYAADVNPDSINIYDTVSNGIDYSNAPSDSIMGQTLQLLTDAKVDPEVTNDFMRLMVDAMPETSLAKSLQKRMGYRGASENLLLGLQTRGYSLAVQTERMRYGAKLAKIQKSMEDARKVAPNETKKQILNSVVERLKFARNPPKDEFARNVNRLGFIGTIGFNPSSSLVNLGQIPIVMWPYLW